MNKLLRSLCFLVFLILISSKLEAQKKIYFEANLLQYDENLKPGVEQYIGNVVFRHENTIGYCDTAFHYRNTNQIEAFSRRIKIIINDSVTLFGEYLLYDGDQRTISISRNVILKDKSATLYTDSLIYDLNKDIAYYITGGKMVNQKNVLTSKTGFYNTYEKMAHLYDSVLLVNNSYTANSDSVAFDTKSQIAYFLSRTHLISDENEIFTDRGWYNTQFDITQLVSNVVMFNDSQHVVGDSMYYDKGLSYGEAWNNVQLIDSSKNYIVQGNYIEYFENGGFSTVTDSSLLILIENRDSLYLHADTLKVLFDTLQNPKEMLAFNRAKFFRGDIQGACDSLVYLVEDSLVIMYYNPVVWSGDNQMTADTIRFDIIDSVNVNIYLRRSGFIVSSIFDNTEFNQIKGMDITGKIVNRELTRVDVIGNAECLYYILEEDTSLIGINSTVASEMRIILNDNEIETITFYNDPDGTIYPDSELEEKERKLKNFRWLSAYRPTTKYDVFFAPISRTNLTELTP